MEKLNPKLIDLTSSQLDLVLQLLSTHLPKTRVLAYGSRVAHTAHESSDLDLVAHTTPEQANAIEDLRDSFAESDLPFRVDLFVWDEVPKKFQDNILGSKLELQES